MFEYRYTNPVNPINLLNLGSENFFISKKIVHL